MQRSPRRQSPAPKNLPRRIIRAAYWLVLLGSLLSYGANNTAALPIATLAIFLILPAAIWFNGVSTVAMWPLRISLLLLAIVTAWSFLQIMPMPNGLFANPIWGDAVDLLSNRGALMSVTPGDLTLGLLKFALPLGTFMVSLVIFNTDDRALFALNVLARSGAVMALVSLAYFQFFPDMLFLEKKRSYIDSLTFPFVNRNTAGTFYGLILLTQLSLVWNRIAKIDIRLFLTNLGQPLDILQKNAIWRHSSLFILLLLPTVALSLTRSRGAALSALIAILAFAIFMTALSRRAETTNSGNPSLATRLGRFGIAIAILVALSLVFGVLTGQSVLRAQIQGLDDGRLCVAPGILLAIRDHWPFGIGLTSFQEVFPAYRDPACGIFGIWDKAHNGYLEGLLTLGIVFPLVVLLAVGSLAFIYIKGIRTRIRLRFVGALGFSSLLLVMVHTGLDFSLQIPALAAFFAALTAPIVTICLMRGAAPARAVTKREFTLLEEGKGAS